MFKEGDVVVFKGDEDEHWSKIPVGTRAMVMAPCENDTEYLWIRWIDRGVDWGDGGWYPHQFTHELPAIEESDPRLKSAIQEAITELKRGE